MKKLIAIVLLMSSCRTNEEKMQVPVNTINYNKVVQLSGYGVKTWQIIEVDSCEYLCGWEGGYNGGPIMTHRARCIYCKQRNDQY